MKKMGLTKKVVIFFLVLSLAGLQVYPQSLFASETTSPSTTDSTEPQLSERAASPSTPPTQEEKANTAEQPLPQLIPDDSVNKDPDKEWTITQFLHGDHTRTVALGTTQEQLPLPTTLPATAVDAHGTKSTLQIPVANWDPTSPYQPDTPGTCTFLPDLNPPVNILITNDIPLPAITIDIQAAESPLPQLTNVTGSITDSNFLMALRHALGHASTAPIYKEELETITYLEVSDWGISSLAGIQYFSSLKTLICSRNNLESLTINGLHNLTTVDCYGNLLTLLSFSDLPALTSLDCGNNYLSHLNLSGIPSLKKLSCFLNELSSLTLTGLNKLTYLDCGDNQLATLALPSLLFTELYCAGNLLTNLSLTGLTHLTNLNCGSNKLTSLSFDSLSSLQHLICSDNQFSTLNISTLSALVSADCSYNNLSSLSTGNLSHLQNLFCNNNSLTSLTFGTLPALLGLNVSDNNLSTLDVKKLSALVSLSCSNNMLSSLQVSGLTKLIMIDCNSNQLSNLDTSNLTSLNALYCSINMFSTLDVSNLLTLTTLDCSQNNLTTLTLGALVNLQSLYCYQNQLKTLTLTSLTALEFFDCSTNLLTSLSVSKSPHMMSLNCNNNLLNTLNITGLTQLYSLDVSHNSFFSSKDIVGLNTQITSSLTYSPQNPSSFVPVTSITGLPTSARIGVPLTLKGTVQPSNATRSSITWSIVSAGTTKATIKGSTFLALASGTVKIRASISSGSTLTTSYVKEFTLTVYPTVSYKVNGIGGTLTAKVDTKTIASNSTVTAGKTVVFTAVPASGYRIQGWTNNGVAVNAQNATYTVSNVQSNSNIVVQFVPVVTTVSIKPSSVSVHKGSSYTFVASVAGPQNPAQTVTWSVSGGGTGTSISSTGKLTLSATESATRLTVKATSTVDKSKYATAIVTVTALANLTTLRDSATGVTVTGVFLQESTLSVTTGTTLHEPGTCIICDRIRAENLTNRFVTRYTLSIEGSYEGDLEVSLPVGDAFDERDVSLVYCQGENVHRKAVVVRGGVATDRLTELSSIAILSDHDNLDNPKPLFQDASTNTSLSSTGDISLPLSLLGALLALSGISIFATQRKMNRLARARKDDR